MGVFNREEHLFERERLFEKIRYVKCVKCIKRNAEGRSYPYSAKRNDFVADEAAFQV